MAKMFLGLCVEDFCPAPDEDATFVLRRGKEYTIGPVKNETVMVCSTYWTRVPARLFAGVVPLGAHTEPWRQDTPPTPTGETR